MQATTAPPTSLQRMRSLLSSWLDKSDWRPEELLDFVQGYGLMVPTASGEEPYLWLLRGLPVAGAERKPAREKLARRLAQVLSARPDKTLPGDDPEQILYNLLMLAAGLGVPQVLAPPLRKMLDDRVLNGQYLGINLRSALRAALAENQPDGELVETWFDMIMGKSGWLPGGSDQGFEAIQRMYGGASPPGEAHTRAIGRALRAISITLEGNSDRRAAFQRSIRMVEMYYGRSQVLNERLVCAADQALWSLWAVECLPSLFVRTMRGTYLAWHYLLACLPQSHRPQVVRSLCSEAVLEIELPHDQAEILQDIADEFERCRLGNPFPSQRSTAGVILEAIQALEERASPPPVISRPDLLNARAHIQKQISASQGVEDITKAIVLLAGAKEGEESAFTHLRQEFELALLCQPSLDWEEHVEDLIGQEGLPTWAQASVRQALTDGSLK